MDKRSKEILENIDEAMTVAKALIIGLIIGGWGLVIIHTLKVKYNF